MPRLRDALTEVGFEDIRTYLQSGNVVLSSTKTPNGVARMCKQVVADAFGLDIDVVVRRRADLARVVCANPLGDAVSDPKRYQVSFLVSKPSPAVVAPGPSASRSSGGRSTPGTRPASRVRSCGPCWRAKASA
jgi:uncharacterized protein (DUF1697 family)